MSKLCNICRTLTVYNTGTASALFSSAQSSCCHCHTLSTAHSRSRANVHPHCSISSKITSSQTNMYEFNPLNTELNPIYHLLALLGAHHILHVSRIRVKCWKWLKNGIKAPAMHFLKNMHGAKLLNNRTGNVRTIWYTGAFGSSRSEIFSDAWFQASAAKYMTNALFWVVTQREFVISYRCFGTTYRSHFRGSRTKKKAGFLRCPETSVRNSHYSLRNDPEEHSYYLFR